MIVALSYSHLDYKHVHIALFPLHWWQGIGSLQKITRKEDSLCCSLQEATKKLHFWQEQHVFCVLSKNVFEKCKLNQLL